MTRTGLAIAALVTMGLAATPAAVEAKKHRHTRGYVSTTQSAGYGTTSGISTPHGGTYGSSGPSIGTVTAPSIGAYTWPSVGVTNARPTWSNTNPR
jgi:hypothetical protein